MTSAANYVEKQGMAFYQKHTFFAKVVDTEKVVLEDMARFIL
ncbi:MAG: hypothetical protein Tsb005_12000 [Gammaproteobacteria bacterium]